MAFERTWPAVSPILFTGDGSAFGIVTVASTFGFKVKQTAILQSNTQVPLQVQVNRVLSSTQMIVGRPGKPLSDRMNISAFTLADHSFAYAEEANKSEVPKVDQYHAVYEQEPTVAWRSVLVDELGRFYRTDNPIPVRLTDGSINVETLNADLRVQLSSKDNDPTAGDVHSSVRIGDEFSEATITDGALNVNVISAPTSNQQLQIIYNEDGTVVTGVTADLVSYTVPVGKKAFLIRIEVSGENIAKYSVLVNSAVKSVKRTYYGSSLNENFEFGSGNGSGFFLNAGDQVDVQVIHGQPATGIFDGTIQVIEIT